jgi:hypothetical protein
MRTVTEWIRTHLLSLPEVAMNKQISIEETRAHVEERTARVFGLIRARVAMGYLRYESNRGRSPCYADWLEASLMRYHETRNIDCLLDVAFYAMAEFQNPSVTNAVYEPEAHESEEL